LVISTGAPWAKTGGGATSQTAAPSKVVIAIWVKRVSVGVVLVISGISLSHVRHRREVAPAK
jgi:hypothetical protein